MAQLLGLGEGGVEWGSLDAAKREELAERMVDVALGAVAFAEVRVVGWGRDERRAVAVWLVGY